MRQKHMYIRNMEALSIDEPKVEIVLLMDDA